MTAKTAILDASSAIILCKSDLHEMLPEAYRVVLPESVFLEITTNQYIGAEEYTQLLGQKKIRVEKNVTQQGKPGMVRLDSGEYDAICLCYAGQGDFLITDDGAAVKYCLKVGLPFINALLFPVVLRFAQMQDEGFCRSAILRVIQHGRYSEDVITFAKNCRKTDIAFALP